MKANNKRFCYYIDLYCIEFYNFILLLNVYFSTTLNFLNKKKKNKKKKNKKKKIFFFKWNFL